MYLVSTGDLSSTANTMKSTSYLIRTPGQTNFHLWRMPCLPLTGHILRMLTFHSHHSEETVRVNGYILYTILSPKTNESQRFWESVNNMESIIGRFGTN